MPTHGSHPPFGFAKIHCAGDGFQNSIGRAALLHGQVKKRGLRIAFGLHLSLIILPQFPFNTFAEISP